MLGIVGGRRQPAGARRAVTRRDVADRIGGLQGGNSVVGGGELSLPCAAGEGGPRDPVGAAGGDAVGLDCGADELVSAGVGDLGVVAGVELPAAAVGRAGGAAGRRRVGVMSGGVAAGLGEADRDRGL